MLKHVSVFLLIDTKNCFIFFSCLFVTSFDIQFLKVTLNGTEREIAIIFLTSSTVIAYIITQFQLISVDLDHISCPPLEKCTFHYQRESGRLHYIVVPELVSKNNLQATYLRRGLFNFALCMRSLLIYFPFYSIIRRIMFAMQVNEK